MINLDLFITLLFIFLLKNLYLQKCIYEKADYFFKLIEYNSPYSIHNNNG